MQLLVTLGVLSAFGPMSTDLYLPAFPAIADSFEMDAEQFATTTLERHSWKLRRIEVADGEVDDAMFELLMGSEVAPRRDFIIANSDLVDDAEEVMR